ncbi:MAG TPA: hypothetical protein VFK81_10430 [Terriglobales bacterium]|nr:hypothetical protein [Terriglobales bacterium]
MVSKRQFNTATPAIDYTPIAAGLERARRLYHAAAQELFNISYAIQATGTLPDPVLLTEALIDYRQARALAEALTLQAAYAADDERLVGTPVPHK